MKKLAVLTALLLISLSASASAHPVSHLIYKESIDGSDAVGVPSPTLSQPRLVAIDQQNQVLYVASEPQRIYKFNAVTHASAPFTALSGTEPTSVITGQVVGVLGNFAVDNSGSANQGRIYAFEQNVFGPPPALYYPSGAKATPEEFSLTRLSGAVCGTEVAPDGSIWSRYTYNSNGGLRQYPPNGGSVTGRTIDGGYTEGVCGQFAIDSQENFYTPEYECCSFIRKFNSEGKFQYSLGGGNSESTTADRSDDSVYVNDSNVITKYSAGGAELDKFGHPEEYAPTKNYPGLSNSPAIAVDEHTKEVFAVNPTTNSVDVFAPGPPKTAADVTITDPLPTFTTAVLHGIVNPDGVPTTECYFEWGTTTAYGQKVNCSEGSVFSGSADQTVSVEIPVSIGNTYNTRLLVKNDEGLISKSANLSFKPQQKPVIDRLLVDELNTDSARLNASVDLELGETTYQFEYGPDTNYGTAVPIPGGVVPAQFLPATLSEDIRGLQPGKLYYYRIIASNLGGTTERSSTFTTFPQVPDLSDTCPNALSRQQTSAALLPDCRSYELASAADTGGYNVESDLIPGQEPFDGHPSVDGQLLYGTHNGGIPGTGNPTNLGVDPYVAVRGDGGWTTKYVGIPADGTPSTSPFSSSLLGADQNLDTFAFGGPDICAPCFGDGTSGIPVARNGSALTQGMTGPVDPDQGAKPDGFISKSLSADGSHLIFGSTSQFAGGGNDETGDVSIYDRNLDTKATQVVSTDP